MSALRICLNSGTGTVREDAYWPNVGGEGSEKWCRHDLWMDPKHNQEHILMPISFHRQGQPPPREAVLDYSHILWLFLRLTLVMGCLHWLGWKPYRYRIPLDKYFCHQLCTLSVVYMGQSIRGDIKLLGHCNQAWNKNVVTNKQQAAIYSWLQICFKKPLDDSSLILENDILFSASVLCKCLIVLMSVCVLSGTTYELSRCPSETILRVCTI